MAKRRTDTIDTAQELFARDEALDTEVCGYGLADPGRTQLAGTGAHDPTPTPYFVLEELFQHFQFTQESHLLDVGCGLGRVLAFFKHKGYPGKATGIEMDCLLAEKAEAWAQAYGNLSVISGDALKTPLAAYTDFYLFNPFDTRILVQFIAAVEAEAQQTVTLVHMSDNGETRFYSGRPGWTKLGSGWFDYYVNERGYKVEVYDQAQHYSAWRFDPKLA